MKKNIWDYSVEELAAGCARTESEVVCPLCGCAFERGRIYEAGGSLFDAEGAEREHVRTAHSASADFLVGRGTALAGISEVQEELLKLTIAGKSDKEIASSLGIAPSTVRNHRFKLREREKQAKLFLAMMKALEYRSGTAGREDETLVETHAGAAMVDERYCITEQEREKVLKTYMEENGAIRQFPSKEKKKLILLREVIKNFKPGVKYTEKEVNRVLTRIYEADCPSLRRALIEYGFMDRSDDCSVYRVRE